MCDGANLEFKLCPSAPNDEIIIMLIMIAIMIIAMIIMLASCLLMIAIRGGSI